MTGYFVEFHNDDVGPFRTEAEAEAFMRFEGQEESQVFASSDCRRPFITLATFCPEAHTLMVADAFTPPDPFQRR